MIRVTKRDNEDRYDLHSKKYHVGIDGEDWVFPKLLFRAKDAE